MIEDSCFDTIEEDETPPLTAYSPDNNQANALPSISIHLEANPVLPQGRYPTSSENQFRLTLNLPRKHATNSSFDNTSYHQSNLPRITDDPDKFNTIPSNNGRRRKYQLASTDTTDDKPSQKHEFTNTIKPWTLVFKRTANDNSNSYSTGSKKYYASYFFEIPDPTTSISSSSKQLTNTNSKNNLTYKNLFPPAPPIPLASVAHRKIANLTQKHPEQDEESLIFISNMQSGNLHSAYRITTNEYGLFMMNDTNSKGCTQWFYFRVKNTKKVRATFHILNFYKESSLFQKGMKPLIYSKARAAANKSNNSPGNQHNSHQLAWEQEWRRAGQSVSYQFYSTGPGVGYYRLSFIYEFEYSDDQVDFAFSYPYTVHNLERYLRSVQQEHRSANRKCITKQVLCRTHLNNNVYLLTITNQNQNLSHPVQPQKPIVYIISRQHAGQSPSSFVLEGLLSCLVSDRLEAIELRDKFVFKVIPMVNVDGVAIGNYRTNLSGHDLNRKWDYPNKKLHPEIYHIKNRMIEDKKHIIFFLDIHAHSRRMNSFFYGNWTQSNIEEIRLFPFVCSKICKDIPREESSYTSESYKKSTARVVMQNELGVRKSYTYEVSFYGRIKDDRRTHFTPQDLREMGQALLLGIYYSEVKVREHELAEMREHFSKFGHQANTTVLNQNLAVHKHNISLELTESASQAHSLLKNSGSFAALLSKQAKYVKRYSQYLIDRWVKEKHKIKLMAQNPRNAAKIQDGDSDSDPEVHLLDQEEIEQMGQFLREKAQLESETRKDDKGNFMSTIDRGSFIQRSVLPAARSVRQHQKKIQFTTLSNLKDRFKKSIPKLPSKKHFELPIAPKENQSNEIKAVEYNMVDIRKTLRMMVGQQSELRRCFNTRPMHHVSLDSQCTKYQPLSTLNKKEGFTWVKPAKRSVGVF